MRGDMLWIIKDIPAQAGRGGDSFMEPPPGSPPMLIPDYFQVLKRSGYPYNNLTYIKWDIPVFVGLNFLYCKPRPGS